jgi:hypothetical protein
MWKEKEEWVFAPDNTDHRTLHYFRHDESCKNFVLLSSEKKV